MAYSGYIACIWCSYSPKIILQLLLTVYDSLLCKKKKRRRRKEKKKLSVQAAFLPFLQDNLKAFQFGDVCITSPSSKKKKAHHAINSNFNFV